MATFFTADTHFGHAAMIKFGRPFSSVTEMDHVMIRAWNTVVQPDDDVWHLGDFCHRSAQAPASYLRRLQGRKHLVHGNHDTSQTRTAREWTSSHVYAEVTVGRDRLVLFHYGLRTWAKVGRGALHFYGHSHGRLPGDRLSCDVGVDCWDFRPVSVAEIKARLETLPARVGVDHHEV